MNANCGEKRFEIHACFNGFVKKDKVLYHWANNQAKVNYLL
jgi:hypothetical protein